MKIKYRLLPVEPRGQRAGNLAFRPFRAGTILVGNQNDLCFFLGEGSKTHDLPHGA